MVHQGCRISAKERVTQRIRNTLPPVGRKSYDACMDSAVEDRGSLGYLTPLSEGARPSLEPKTF